MNFTFAAYVAVAYFVVKIIETKYISKKELDTKELGKNAVLVFVSAVIVSVVNDKVNPTLSPDIVKVFTDGPKF